MDQDDDGILWDVVEEHLDEAEFLWSSWERGLTAANLTLADLAVGAEARMRAHIDGLVVAAPAVVERLLAPALHDYQRDRAAAAAWAWLAIAGDRAVPALCEHLGRADPPECQGIARALGLYEGEVVGQVESLLRAESAAAQAAALAVFAAQRRSPGSVLAELVEQWFHGPADSDVVQRRVACVELGVPAALLAGLAGEFGEAGFDLALWTGLRRGFTAAREAVWRSPERRSAALVLGACGGERGLRTLLAGLGSAPAAVLWGLGFSGRRAAADACVEWLAHAELGPLAAESLAAITGLDLEGERMTIRRDSEEPDDDEIPATSVDDGLPYPDSERVRAWWSANRSRFEAEGRYFFGVRAESGGVGSALERAAMRRQPGLAFELAMRTRGRVDIDPRWFTRRQRALHAQVVSVHVNWTTEVLV